MCPFHSAISDRARATGRDQTQSGQALIEFAIVMFVIVLLAAGGVELALGSYHGVTLRDAVKEGVVAYTEVRCSTRDRAGVAAEYRLQADGSCQAVEAFLLAPEQIGDAASEYRLATDDTTLIAFQAADHSLAASFAAPSCDDAICSAPTNGLPAAAGDPQTGYFYYFNPKPIDATQCVPPGGAVPKYRDCVNRIFSGFCERRPGGGSGSQPCSSPDIYHPGLPPLNQSLYGLYQLRCYDGASNEVECGDATVARWLLRLPGRFDPLTDTVSVARTCIHRPEAGLNCEAADGRIDAVRDASESAHYLRALGEDGEDVDGVRPVFWTDGTSVRVIYRHFFYSFLGSRFYNDGESGRLAEDVYEKLDLGVIDAAGVQGGGLGAEVVSTGADAYFKVPAKTLSFCFYRPNPASSRVAECP